MEATVGSSQKRKRALIAIAIGVLLLVALGVSMMPHRTSDWTVDRVNSLLTAKTPIGTARPSVAQFLKGQGISFSSPPGRDDTINARIPGTSKGLFIEGSIFIVFEFGADDTLKKFTVDEVYTAP